MARPAVLAGLAVALLSACGESPREMRERELSAELAGLESRSDAVKGTTDAAEARVAALESRTNRAVAEFGETAAAFEDARRKAEGAAAQGMASAGRSREAQAAFEDAAQKYRVAAYAVIVLAATAAVAQAVCAGRMSTSDFRAQNGMKDPDVHVDHIWPRARGGLDHPLNYQQLDAHTNMSCGQGCLGSKFAASPLAFTTGLAVSILGRLGCP